MLCDVSGYTLLIQVIAGNNPRAYIHAGTKNEPMNKLEEPQIGVPSHREHFELLNRISLVLIIPFLIFSHFSFFLFFFLLLLLPISVILGCNFVSFLSAQFSPVHGSLVPSETDRAVECIKIYVLVTQ